MRSLYVWIGVGAVCTMLGAGLLGQRVLGQPDPPSRELPLPLPPSSANGTLPAGGTAESNDPIAVQVAPVPADTPVRVGLPPLQPAPVPPLGGLQFPSTMPPEPSRFNSTFPSQAPANFGPSPGVTLPGITAQESRSGKSESVVTTEFVGPASAVAKLGQPIPCQILVRNSGNTAVHQVVVRHQLPEGVEQRGCEPPANVEGRTLSWNLGTLEAGQTRKIGLQLVSQMRGPLNCSATVTFSSASAMQLQVREPLLTLKIKGPERVVAGEEAVFQITLSNPGDGLTENISLDAILPDGLEHPSVKHRKLKLSIQSLAPKETRTMQLPCIARGSGRQVVEVAATAETSLKAADTSIVEVLLPRLDLAVTGPKLRYIDRHAVYTLKVSNPGGVPANNVMLTEVIPPGFKFVQATGKGEMDREKHIVVWSVGDLMPGQVREVTLDLLATAAGDHRLIGLVNSARGTKTEAEVRTRVEAVSRIEVDVTDTEDPVEVGAETTYQIRVLNRGSKVESNVQVVCQLPEEMQLVKTNSMPHHLEGRTVVFDPIPNLAPGVSAPSEVLFSVTAKGMQPGNMRVRVQVRADSLSEPIVREETTRFYSDDVPAR